MQSLNTRGTLIQRMQIDRDDQSWEEFYLIYSRYLYVVIRNMNINHHDCEDLLQQVLLKAWKGLPTFDYQPDKHRFRSWLYTITKNSVRSFVVKKSTQMSKAGDSADQDLKIYLSHIEEAEIDKIASREWENYIANLAFENIQSKFQPHVIKAFELCIEGLSCEEASTQLDIPVNTIHVYKKRVQAALFKEAMRRDHELG